MDGERAYFTVTASTAIVLFAADDAGHTWSESAPLHTNSHVVALSFADVDDGWLLTTEGAAMGRNPVQVYRTTDAGRRWSLTASSPPIGSNAGTGIPVACDKTGISFPAVTAGWLTSECAAALPEVLLVSRDGGVTWAAQPLPVPSGVTASGPEFVDGTGFLTLSQDSGPSALLVTTNIGRTWRRLPLPSGAGSDPQVKFFSSADGVLVPAGAQGSLGDVFYTTSDGGQTWTAVKQGRHFTQLGVAIDFVSQRTGLLGFSAAIRRELRRRPCTRRPTQAARGRHSHNQPDTSAIKLSRHLEHDIVYVTGSSDLLE